jgi:hypothetical protein
MLIIGCGLSSHSTRLAVSKFVMMVVCARGLIRALGGMPRSQAAIASNRGIIKVSAREGRSARSRSLGRHSA